MVSTDGILAVTAMVSSYPSNVEDKLAITNNYSLPPRISIRYAVRSSSQMTRV
jgi:hypothetical protein